MKILLILYDFILILSIFFYLFSLLLKGKFNWQVFKRFGLINKEAYKIIKEKEVIWLHAVSLGEVLACKKLIKELSARYPENIILITTVTLTGKKSAESLEGNNVLSLFIPFDLSFLIKNFIKRIKPKILVLIETELWPNLLYYTKKLEIPVLVLNARISDRSFGKYRIFNMFVKNFAKDIKVFCVQSELDKKRFLELGIDNQRIKVTGNMKFDAIEGLDSKQGLYLSVLKNRLSITENDFVIVAGSTHDNEEEYVLDAFVDLKKQDGFGNLRLIIAPRHLERLDVIENLIREKNLMPQRVSKSEFVSNDSILLLDTVGDLGLIYNLANLVFVGGSLVNVGGHNILEPAFFQKPIIVGPYMHNFREITKIFLESRSLVQVMGSNELKEKIKELIIDKTRLVNLGSAAKSALISKQGATLANLAVIGEYVSAI